MATFLTVSIPSTWPLKPTSITGRTLQQAMFAPPHFVPVPVAANLAGGVVGAAYSETISAQGGTTPYTFAVFSGALPAGTTLAPSTGIISGTPTTAGTFTFSIKVTDSLGFIGFQGFQIIVATPLGAGGSYTFIS